MMMIINQDLTKIKIMNQNKTILIIIIKMELKDIAAIKIWMKKRKLFIVQSTLKNGKKKFKEQKLN